MGIEEERQVQGQEHGQLLGKVVGVVKEGVDPARHALIEVHILLGSHDIHADIALIAAVEGGHREAQHRQGHHELELLILAHHADHQQHQQKPVRWKAKKRRERRVDREPARAIQIKAI